MCKINCSGGCINCAPEEHIENLQNQLASAQAREAKAERLGLTHNVELTGASRNGEASG